MGRAASETRLKGPWWVYSDNNYLHLCPILYSTPAVKSEDFKEMRYLLQLRRVCEESSGN